MTAINAYSGAASQGQAEAITNAAHAWGINPAILWGVYGAETDFGRAGGTSTTGAQGAFQFEPQTAAQYDYPLTNNPSDPQFTQQADAAAHYLADLFKQYGNWDTALNHYSGGTPAQGGYGLSQIEQKVNGGPKVKLQGDLGVQGTSDWALAGGFIGVGAAAVAIEPEAIGVEGLLLAGRAAAKRLGTLGKAAAGAGAGGALAKALSKLETAGTVGAALAALLDPSLLLRMAEIVGGFALLVLALRSLTGSSQTIRVAGIKAKA